MDTRTAHRILKRANILHGTISSGEKVIFYPTKDGFKIGIEAEAAISVLIQKGYRLDLGDKEKPKVTTQSDIVVRACNELISKVRFERAGFTLGDHWLNHIEEDTAAIKAATKNYMESWVIPIIEAIRDGDTRTLKEFCS